MAQDGGGIYALLDLIEDEERLPFLEYDFLTRYQIGVDELPDRMSFDTAARQVRLLRSDPSSALAAQMEGWSHPVSRVEALLMDLWDLTAATSGAKKPPTYPRQWKAQGQSKRRGDAAGRSPEEIQALLRAKLGQPEAPV